MGLCGELAPNVWRAGSRVEQQQQAQRPLTQLVCSLIGGESGGKEPPEWGRVLPGSKVRAYWGCQHCTNSSVCSVLSLKPTGAAEPGLTHLITLLVDKH